LAVHGLSDLSGCLLAVSEPVPGKTHDGAVVTTAGYDTLRPTLPPSAKRRARSMSVETTKWVSRMP
jgi:hypothetical protein